MNTYNPEAAEMGARIVARREQLGMSAAELAVQADISAAALSQIESGQRFARVQTLIAIAKALKVSLDCLQPQGLDQYSNISTDMSIVVMKLKTKSFDNQKTLTKMFNAMVDTI